MRNAAIFSDSAAVKSIPEGDLALGLDGRTLDATFFATLNIARVSLVPFTRSAGCGLGYPYLHPIKPINHFWKFQEMKKSVGRRTFLSIAAAAATSAIAAPALAFPRFSMRSKALSFHNLHTDESLDLVYWADGEYLADATQRIEHLMRDFRNNEIHPIDPRLLDLLSTLRERLKTDAPYQIISGFRSPETNAMLRRISEGVASNSLHMQGQAIDLRVPGVALERVHETALALQGGGVGYYPRSEFVHVDVGPVRRW